MGIPEAISADSENARGGRFYVDDSGAVGDGVTLDTVKIQSTIDDAMRAGGGKVIFGLRRYLTGPLFVKPVTGQEPIAFLGEHVNAPQVVDLGAGRQSMLVMNAPGDMLRVNLDEAGNSVIDPGRQYINFTMSNLAFHGTYGAQGVTAVRSFRTRGIFEKMSSTWCDWLIKQDDFDASSNQNYCDQSVYRDMHMSFSTLGLLRLSYADVSRIENIYAESPSGQCKWGIILKSSKGFTLRSFLSSHNGDIGDHTGAMVYLWESSGILENLYVEGMNFGALAWADHCANLLFRGVQERYDGRTAFKIYGSSNVIIDGHINEIGNRMDGCYDFDLSNHTYGVAANVRAINCQYRSDSTTRRSAIIYGDNVLGLAGDTYQAHIKYNGTSWDILDRMGTDMSPILGTPTWDTDALIFLDRDGITPKNYQGFVPSRRASTTTRCLLPMTQDSDGDRVTFWNDAGARVTSPDPSMNFDAVISHIG